MLYTGKLRTKDFPILLLEDDSSIVGIMQRVSKKSFPEARYIPKASFKEAVSYFFNLEGTWPKLIVVDIYLLGEETGLHFLQFIKEQPAGFLIPVIVLSGTHSGMDVENSYSLGAASFVSKPSELQGWKVLLASMRSYWSSTILPEQPFNFHESNLN